MLDVGRRSPGIVAEQQPHATPASFGMTAFRFVYSFAVTDRASARMHRPRERQVHLENGWRRATTATAAVAGLFALWMIAFYWPAFSLGVVSDGWALLGIGSLPLRDAAATPLEYHIIPVTHLLNALLWRSFGLHESAYQWLNLTELLAVAVLLYRVGLRLFDRPLVAGLGGLLFLANSSFYEVPLWPIVGNFQSLAAALYLGALLAALAALRSPRPWGWATVYAVISGLACLTYEPAASVLPVGGLLLAPALSGRRSTDAARGPARGAWPLAAAAFLTIVLLAGLRAALMTRHGHAFFLPTDLGTLYQRVFYLVRTCAGIFSLRGADGPLLWMMSLGSGAAYGSPALHYRLAAWLLALAAGAALLLHQRRQPAVRFLAGWLVVHLTLLTAATTPVSRHCLIPSLPAALLSAWLVVRGTETAARWLVTRTRRPWLGGSAIFVAVASVAGLLFGAKNDLDRAVVIYGQATAATREVERLLLRRLAVGTPFDLIFVNMPTGWRADGVGVYAFANSLRALPVLVSRGRIPPQAITNYKTYGRDRLDLIANHPQPITFAQLRDKAGDPRTLVIAFDARTRSVVQLRRDAWPEPWAYTPETASYLAWQGSDPPRISVYPSAPLELPLLCRDSPCWAAVRFLRKADTDFDLTTPDGAVGRTRRHIAKPYWTFAVLPASPRAGSTTVTISARAELSLGGAWSFSAPASYTPQAAPFLDWQPDGTVSIREAVDLPLATDCSSSCTVVVRYLAQAGREFAIRSSSAEIWSDPGVFPPVGEERRAQISVSDARTTVTIEPSGSLPVVLGGLDIVSRPESLR
jgi:hypothetical protein